MLIGRLQLCLTAAVAMSFSCATYARAGSFPLGICGSSAREPGDGLSWSAAGSMKVTAACPAIALGAAGLQLYSPSTVHSNASAGFKVNAPAGIVIDRIHVIGAYSNEIGANGWWGEFYWNGGPGPAGRSAPLTSRFATNGCCSATNLQSSTIGWFIACRLSTCRTSNPIVYLGLSELDLTATETRAPTIIANGAGNLWYQSGWVRGRWPASFSASDPSGVCGAAVVFGSLPPIVTPTPDTAPDRHVFHQCPDQNVPASVDTSASDGSQGRGEGAMALRLTATNTADVTANATKTVYADNSTPTIALSGPTDAPSTAGTQYVNATAGGSPSGIADIVCAVDGGPAQRYPATAAHVPVTGIGPHTVSCYGENNAVNYFGIRARSATAGWSLKIGRPTLLRIAFKRIVGLRCHRARVRVRIPGRWITVHRHGHRVRVRTRAHTRLERVVRCHPRHVVAERQRRVAFGRRTTVSGWLGTTSGTALAGQVVHVLAAPANGSDRYRTVASVRTGSDGSWRARLPAGPSQIVIAAYGGDPTDESTFSAPIREIVPAKVKLLRVAPTHVRWGGTVQITGRLLGGYLPPGGALVRLRIGAGRTYTTYGIQEHVTGNGRFTTTYTFGAGPASYRRAFWFQIASLPMGDYPWAPSSSNRKTVIVGG